MIVAVAIFLLLLVFAVVTIWDQDEHICCLTDDDDVQAAIARHPSSRSHYDAWEAEIDQWWDQGCPDNTSRGRLYDQEAGQ